jgi:AhpD family alkylhydroperoxidase
VTDAHTVGSGRRALKDGAPDMFHAFADFDRAVLADDTALPKRYKELIAVAVALTTQCPGCLRGHSEAARAAGATADELAETVHIAAALRAGAAMYHGMVYVTPPTDGPA